jgi:predicted nucleic acid-binding protein
VNLVDSSAWLEYFADGANASFFAPAVEDTRKLVVPTIVILEVYKRILQQRNTRSALEAVAVLQQGRVVDLTATLAIAAARISQSEKLPLADSVILATARAENATVWTQDADFEKRENVKFRAKRS